MDAGHRETPSPKGDDLLKRFLAGNDAPCPVCRYNLRGLDAALCPECGGAIKLGIVEGTRHITGWGAAIILWSGSAVVATALAIVVTIAGSATRTGSTVVLVSAILSVVLWCGTITLGFRPAWYFRSRWTVRYLIALAPIGIPIGLMMWKYLF